MSVGLLRICCWKAALRHLLAAAIFAATCFGGQLSASAQSAHDQAGLKGEIEELKKEQAAMRDELRALRQLIEQQKPPKVIRRSEKPFNPVDITVATAPTLGDANAPVTLVEFTDYQCSYCRRHNLYTKPQLIKDFVESGELKYVLRESPIANIHPNATKAAESALCAGEQGKYWDMNERLFQNQNRLQSEDLIAHAEAIQLDMMSFKECLEGNKYAEHVRGDFRDAARAGVTGTPTFFFGRTDPDNPDKIRATKILRGAHPYAAFKRKIDDLIAEADKGS